MKSDNITVYRLKEDWEPFDKGAEFIDNNDGAYALKINADVTAKIPADLLEFAYQKRWRPKRGEEYYYIHNYGNIDTTSFCPAHKGDESKVAMGNCFKTKEEAKDMRSWLKARQRLIDSGAEFMNSVGVGEDAVYYGVAFDKTNGELHTVECHNVGDDVFDKRLYFLSEYTAEKSIRYYRSDWLTYLGVKKDGDDQD